MEEQKVIRAMRGSQFFDFTFPGCHINDLQFILYPYSNLFSISFSYISANSKVDDHFDSLQLDLINIRNRFESGPEENHNNQLSIADKSSLQRSESIHARMQK